MVRNAARLFKLLHQCVERAEAALEIASDPAAGWAPATAAVDALSPQAPHPQAPTSARAVSAPVPSAEATSPSTSASASASASSTSLPPARPGSAGSGTGAATTTPEDEERLLTMQPILAAQRKNQALMRHYEAKKDRLTPAERAQLVRRTGHETRSTVVELTQASGAGYARLPRQRTQFYRQMLTNMQVAQTQQEEVRSVFNPRGRFTGS